MDGKTHAAVGALAALVVATDPTPANATSALIFGVLGALIPDVDVGTSKMSRAVKAIGLDVVILAVAIPVARIVGGIDVLGAVGASGVLSKFPAMSIVGLIGFLALAFLGLRSGHRTFTHSVLGLALFSLSFAMVAPGYVAYFAAGMVSHLVLDVLNTKGCQYLYPYPKRWCMGVCKASGRVPNVIRTLAIGACVLRLGLAVV